MSLKKLYIYIKKATILAVLLCIVASLIVGLHYSSPKYIAYGILWLMVLILILYLKL